MQNLTVLFFSKFHNGFKGILPVVRKKEAKTRGLKETTSTAKAEILGYSPNGAIISIWCVKKRICAIPHRSLSQVAVLIVKYPWQKNRDSVLSASQMITNGVRLLWHKICL